MEDLTKKEAHNERLHWVVLDRNVKLDKEYEQMMLASLVFVSWKAQIANEFKTIGEYGRSNQIWEF
jgi:hypothetical protein